MIEKRRSERYTFLQTYVAWKETVLVWKQFVLQETYNRSTNCSHGRKITKEMSGDSERKTILKTNSGKVFEGPQTVYIHKSSDLEH